MSSTEPEIIEAEIVEDISTKNAKHTNLQGEGTPVSEPLRANVRPAWHTPGDHARLRGDNGGLLGGLLVLAVGFIVTAVVLVFSVCILIPFTLLMRLFGVHKRN